MKNQIHSNNQNGYGEKAYNHVRKKGGVLCVENSQNGVKLYYQRWY
ncbi:hypothetical protein [Flavobacterium turcicum]|uniref:Uncharacterized protein n=1 Tax=Flavobacterium turcicum TaxID=2764718 RepID=A0ABR7JCJ9_9FLAO|nr:hypothetical protein [Flavobacterium turcicum]MBC5862203.1 hypothetical protein [Flavobacterium turcicum]NHL00934.1 hypothetical protein [Flavobacterium turcicum]